jgi:hypothetical protein
MEPVKEFLTAIEKHFPLKQIRGNHHVTLINGELVYWVWVEELGSSGKVFQVKFDDKDSLDVESAVKQVREDILSYE